MASEAPDFKALMDRRISLIQELTDLNARHISMETRLSGIEIELAHYRDVADVVVQAGERTSQLRQLESDYQAVIDARATVDLQRDDLNRQMLAIDQQMARIDQ